MSRRTVVDPQLGKRVRHLRKQLGWTQTELARQAFVSASTVSDVERGEKEPIPETVTALDTALGAGGELRAMVTEVEPQPAEQATRWEMAELLERLRSSDVPMSTVEALHRTAFELCCDYRWRAARELREDGLRWLREVRRLLARQVGLRQHQELLTVAGWLALLVGCVEYDLDLRAEAEATRRAALTLATEAGNTEIAAWAWEMSAWFALTQGRYRDVVIAAEAGQAVVGEHTAAVQLVGQQAKALGRIGDRDGVQAALDHGRHLLDRFPYPEHPEHHFVVDPDKFDFYAMDAYRLVGADDLSRRHAEEVLRLGTGPDGTERAPMRMAEARLTLGVVAARAGELEEAVDRSLAAFYTPRRSLPSLTMVAREAEAEMVRLDRRARLLGQWGEAMRSLSADSAGSADSAA